MLLSSILQILNERQLQPKAAVKSEIEKFEMEAIPTVEKTPGLQKIEIEIAATTGFARPLMPYPTGTLLAGLSLEELIKAVTKFEKAEQSRVVDVFE
jgi:hypothetical protein